MDSTFERLDREIREAKAHLMGQEEAFKVAVSQLNEDVDGKLDRMELEPLKEYFGGCCPISCTSLGSPHPPSLPPQTRGWLGSRSLQCVFKRRWEMMQLVSESQCTFAASLVTSHLGSSPMSMATECML